MARALRIEVAGGWYHVMNRGHRGGALFLDDVDRRRFLGAVSELPDRYGLEVHAFVLMGNHYHLLVRTREANLSHAIRWLNVTYAIKFNWAHRWRGAVFQGRYKSVLIQEQSGAMEVARYIHLNPVRVGGLGLSKREQRSARVLGCEEPGRELVNRRLEALRAHRWSSWRVYMGAEPRPHWLETGVISQGCGGRWRAERQVALKNYTERPIRQGGLESPWDGLIAGIVLGDGEYARRVLSGHKVDEQEQTSARRMRRRVEWGDLVAEAEQLKGESWEEWAERHGDWGRDAVMYVGMRYGRLRLVDIARHAGMKYQAAAQAVRRFKELLPDDVERERFVSELKHQISNV